MFKNKNNVSIKEEKIVVRKWGNILPEKNKTKIFINNWMNQFLIAVKVSTMEDVENLTVITYAASKLILQKMLLICKDSNVVAANNLLIANRSRADWIKENINLYLTDNHSKILLIKTKENYYISMSSGNFSENKIGKLEHFTILNNEKTFHEISNHYKKLKNGSTKRK